MKQTKLIPEIIFCLDDVLKMNKLIPEIICCFDNVLMCRLLESLALIN